MHHLSHEVLKQIQSYIQNYGYMAVFFGIMIENTGIPFPGETILVVGGFLAGQGIIQYQYLVLAAICGAVLGDNLGYLLGRWKGRYLLDTYGKWVWITPNKVQKVEEFFKQYGKFSIFIARYVAVVRIIGALVAGIARMQWQDFLVYNMLGAIAWVLTFTSIGFFLGHSLETTRNWTHIIHLSSLFIFILFCLIIYIKTKLNDHTPK